MTKKISTDEAKEKLSEIVQKVAENGERYLVESDGKPVAGVVSVSDLERLEASRTSQEPRGAIALVGSWPEVDAEEWRSIVEGIYEARARDKGRPVELDS